MIISDLLSRSGCVAVGRSGPSPTEEAETAAPMDTLNDRRTNGDTFSDAAGVLGRPRHSHATVKAGSFMGTFNFITKSQRDPFRTRP